MSVVLDFEIASLADLKRIGSAEYARHPSTRPLCLAYSLPGERPIYLWHPGYEKARLRPTGDPTRLFEEIAKGTLLEAHHAFFEQVIWAEVMVKRYGWPAVPQEQWRCSQAKAAAAAIPRKLERAAAAVGLKYQKDMKGHRVMLRVSKYHPDRQLTREQALRLLRYCVRDVAVERELSEFLRDLSPEEWEVWLHDQRINHRGFALDLELARKAVALSKQAAAAASAELARITAGAVPGLTSRIEMRDWMRARGVNPPIKLNAKAELIETTERAALQNLLQAGGLPAEVDSALRVWIAANKTSVAKYQAMLERGGSDGRAREGFTYHGASTGRWCLTGDHEVLTEEGWVRLDNWTGGRIACWNPNEIVTFQKAEAISFDYAGPLVAHTSKRINQLATPEHRMPNWHVKTGAFQVSEVGDLRGRCVLPYTGRRIRESAGDVNALRVLVMVQADGHYREDGDLILKFKKQRKIERCRTLLRRAGLIFRESENEVASTSSFVIARRHMPLYLTMFSDKVFGWWMLEANHDVLFDELEHWDAYRCGPNSVQYSSIVKQNADVIQACAHLSGRSATQLVKARENEAWSNSFIVNIWLTPSNRHEYRKSVNEVSFEGKVYCAKTETGFFLVRRGGFVWVTGNSGGGVQPQNLPRPEEDLSDTDQLCSDLLDYDYGTLELLYGAGRVPALLASACRGAIIAAPGHDLIDADFSAIETRGAGWLANDEELLEVFRQLDADPKANWDVYTWQASQLLGRPITKKDKIERQNWGKVPTLGATYQMSGKKLVSYAAAMGVVIEEEVANEIVAAWRAARHKIRDFWYQTEECAVEAVRRRAYADRTITQCGGRVRWRVVGRFLYMRLPSGRLLSYLDPEIQPSPKFKDRRGKPKPMLTFMGMNTYTHKWERCSTYGGKLFENMNQGMCRDLLVSAVGRAEKRGYPVVLHAHDEICAEVPKGVGSIQEFEALMGEAPAWAEGFPIVASGGWRGRRYRK